MVPLKEMRRMTSQWIWKSFDSPQSIGDHQGIDQAVWDHCWVSTRCTFSETSQDFWKEILDWSTYSQIDLFLSSPSSHFFASLEDWVSVSPFTSRLLVLCSYVHGPWEASLRCPQLAELSPKNSHLLPVSATQKLHPETDGETQVSFQATQTYYSNYLEKN